MLHVYKQEENNKENIDNIKEHNISVPSFLKIEEPNAAILKLVKFKEKAKNLEKSGIQNEFESENNSKSENNIGIPIVRKQSLTKLKSITIKNKHQISREDKTSNILLPLLSVWLSTFY